jgi:hypothetical protein
MTSFLKRYQQGEYEQVWKDLLALGDWYTTRAPFPRRLCSMPRLSQ